MMVCLMTMTIQANLVQGRGESTKPDHYDMGSSSGNMLADEIGGVFFAAGDNQAIVTSYIEISNDFLTPTTSHANDTRLRSEFKVLADQWYQETGGYSLMQQKTRHWAYRRITKMGQDAIPMILGEFQQRGGYWHEALESILQRTPFQVPGNVTLRQLRDLWLKWGHEVMYI